MSERVPNELLGSWFVRSGWSKGELARLVNRRARDLGATHVATDTSRVRRWLDGEQPRDPIPRILTELFGERFGCVVTLSDLGLREPASPIAGTLADLPWSGERTAELLAEFCRSDLILGRRGAGGGAPPLAAGSALVEPVKRWLLPAAAVRTVGVGVDAHASVPGPRSRGGRLALLAEQLEEAARTFRAWDAAAGGGIRRAAVVGQLYEVAELIRQAPDHSGHRLFRIAAEIALLSGEMAFDSRLQATAQRYQILALHAAMEAGDKALAIGILAAMGRQQIHLKRAQDALDLLAIGRSGARGEIDPLAAALADAVESRAFGALGFAEACQYSAERAKVLHAKARAQERGADWLAWFTLAALHTDLGLARCDLAAREPSVAVVAAADLETAVGLYEREWPGHLRGRVTALAGAAEARIIMGDASAAAEHLRAASALAVRLRSRHTEERLREVAARARHRFPQDPALRELSERLREPAGVAAPGPAISFPAQAFTRT